jgi:hypothetical protein
MPFGLCNAPNTFRDVWCVFFSDLIENCIEIY